MAPMLPQMGRDRRFKAASELLCQLHSGLVISFCFYKIKFSFHKIKFSFFKIRIFFYKIRFSFYKIRISFYKIRISFYGIEPKCLNMREIGTLHAHNGSSAA